MGRLWLPTDDPTRIGLTLDPFAMVAEGYAVHGNTWFSCPLLTRLDESLTVGGCVAGTPLPDYVRHVVSLYPWESYALHADVTSVLSVVMHDAGGEVDGDRVIAVARWVNACRADAPTLVHCQAGLNRSALVTVTALVLDGLEPADAIAYLREQRSDAVLCNPSFERYVLEHAAAARGDDEQAAREKVQS